MSIYRGLQMAASSSIYTPPAPEGWNIANATYNSSFSVAARETNPTGVFFKPDGTRMYIIGYANNNVVEYSLSTAWSVTTAVYVRQFYVVYNREVQHQALFFSQDGTKLFVVGTRENTIYLFNLSTAWDISSASFGETFRPGDTNIRGIYFKSDGTKMYYLGNSGYVFEYNLSVPWSISTGTYVRQFYVYNREQDPNDIFFKPDGTKMYIIGPIADSVIEYSLTTAWNISTAVYSRAKSVAVQEGAAYGLFFKIDGTKMYVTGLGSVAVIEYNL